MGRPSKFNDTLAAEICERIEGGRSLTSVCEDTDMPSKPTVARWLEANETFRNSYARACEERAAALAEEALSIADGLSGKVFSSEDVQAAKLQVDTRKWFAAKLSPKRFGDRIQADTNVNATVTGALALRAIPEAELDRIIGYGALASTAPGRAGRKGAPGRGE